MWWSSRIIIIFSAEKLCNCITLLTFRGFQSFPQGIEEQVERELLKFTLLRLHFYVVCGENCSTQQSFNTINIWLYADPVAELVKAGVAIQSSEVGGSTLGLAKTADF